MLCVVEMRHLGVTSLASANRVPEVMDYKRSQLAGNLVIKHSDGTGVLPNYGENASCEWQGDLSQI